MALLLSSGAVAATLVVTTTEDQLDLEVPGGPVPVPGVCSLREAVVSSNEGRDVGGCLAAGAYGDDVIEVPAGSYDISRVGFFVLLEKPDQEELDLDVYGRLAIEGAGADETVLSGLDYNRLLEVHEDAVAVVRNLAMTRGVAPTLDTAISDSGGGGAVLNRGRLTLDGVVVHGNTARTAGGGVQNLEGGDLTIVASTIRGNVAHDVVAGGIHNAGELVMERSTLSGNASLGTFDFGGGGLLSDGTSRLENVTVSSNSSATYGGGISVREGVTILSSVTLARNAANRGGGLFVLEPADARMENTLLAGNRVEGDGPADPDCRGAIDSFGYNLVGVGDGCSGLDAEGDQVGSETQPLRPRLELLELRGGPTATHALSSGSPALDRGPLESNDACLPSDQRGEPRPRDGDGDGLGTRCDVGAYEAPDAPTTADLAVALQSGPGTVTPGSGVAFLVVVHNDGPSVARGARVSVVLDDGVTLPELPGGACTTLGQQFSCPLGDLPAGGTDGLAFDLVAPDEPGEMITAAAAGHDGDDPESGDDRREAVTTVRLAAADLRLQQDLASPAIDPFATTVLDVEARNDGPDPATDAQIVIDLVADSAQASFIAFGGCTPGASAAQALCPLGRLAPSTTASAALTVQAHANEGSLSVVSQLEASEDDPAPAAARAETTLIVGTPDAPLEGADARLALTGPAGVTSEDSIAEVPPDAPFSYRFDVTNAGPEAVSSATLLQTITDDVSVDVVPPDCTLGSDPVGNATVSCAVGSLGAGGHRAFTIDARTPPDLGSFTMQASITNSSPDDPETGNNFAFLAMRVREPVADLALSVAGPDVAVPEARLNLRAQVDNAGPDAAESVLLTATAPPGGAFLSGSSGCDVLEASATCTLGTIAAGASGAITLELRAPPATGPYQVEWQAESATPDPDLGDDAATTAFEIVPYAVGSDLALAIEGPAAAEAGDELRYAIDVRNDGPETATDVVVLDTISDGAVVAALPTACTMQDAAVHCTLGELAPGGADTLELRLRAEAGGGVLVNTAQVEAAGVDPNPDNDHASVLTVLTGGAEANLRVSAGAAAPSDGAAARASRDVPTLQARLEALESLSVSAVQLSEHMGTDGRGLVERLAAYVDTDEDGRVGAGDVLLAEGTLGQAGTAQLVFESALTLEAGEAMSLLVVMDVADRAAGSAAMMLLAGLLLLPLTPLMRRGLRRGVLALSVALVLVACAGGGPGDPTWSVRHDLTAVAGPGVVADGLPLEGATLRIE